MSSCEKPPTREKTLLWMATFDTESESLSRLLVDIGALISERDVQRSRGGNTGESVGKIRSLMTKGDKLLEKIMEKITPEAGGPLLSQKEIQRRRDIVRRSQSELGRLRGLEKNVAMQQSASDRDALLRGSAKGGDGGGGGNPEPRLTSEQLMTKTKEETKTQDDLLDVMSRGLDGLKSLGVAIRDETDLQVTLLDKLEGEVDKGNTSLKTETARTEYITRDANTCWLYITICLLLAALVGLLAFYFSEVPSKKS